MSIATRKPEYFDYPSVARLAGITETDLQQIETRVKADYPNDQMMFELRVLRTCRAIADGHATVHDALTDPRDDRSSAA